MRSAEMPNSKWLWLSEAADRIASRLTQAEPERFASRKKALRVACNQLLDEAYRGDIKVRGKDVVPQEEPQFDPRKWKVPKTEFWDPIHRQKRTRSPLRVELNWMKNCILCEAEGAEWIIGSLQVKADDIDHIWPQQTLASSQLAAHDSPASDETKAKPELTNSGGRPSIYKDDIIREMIRIANTPDGLPDNANELSQRLKKLNLPHWPDGGPSPNLIPGIVKKYYDTSRPKT